MGLPLTPLNRSKDRPPSSFCVLLPTSESTSSGVAASGALHFPLGVEKEVGTCVP